MDLTPAFELLESSSWASKIADNFEVARAKFLPMMTEYLCKLYGANTVVVSATVKNAVDRHHFLSEGWKNQYVGRFNNNIMAKKDKLQALCDRYGLFCVMPEESNVVYVWIPTYFGGRCCATFMHDMEELMKIMGETIDKVWGERKPAYNAESFAKLKSVVTGELMQLLPPVEQINVIKC